ncbi:hypothetical protein MAR_011353 [Mya arenaria]|uniref:B box-type domain-containing protein n=1 Tax=Mya arenaria TaxID=6604 RepID=A0ABY7FWL1_MYAAR|nr:uncharacterized protein LOC128216819 [Mya arenaria]WAR25649.1 hypothetical protein MAR_011353 [Mya arenaria]
MEIVCDTSSKTTSDSEYDYTCSPCNDEELNKEAQYFCGECAQFYCNECEQWHKKIRKRHVVLGREDSRQWLQAPIQSVVEDLERCKKHPNKALELYCGGHDQLCCHLCVANNHSNCSVVKHIPVLARGFRETETFKKLPYEVKNYGTSSWSLESHERRVKRSLKSLGIKCWTIARFYVKKIMKFWINRRKNNKRNEQNHGAVNYKSD